MRPENSLRRRIVAAYLLLAVAVGSVFGTAVYMIVETMEHELLEVRLSRAGALLMQAHRTGTPSPPSLDLRFAVDDQIPPEMRSLPPGLHEIESSARTFEVLIVHEGDQRFAIIDDITEFERIELMSFVALSIAFVSSLLLALALARISVNRVVAPLRTLTAAVQHDALTAHGELITAKDEIGILARAFSDSSARERLFTADMSHELRTPLTVILGAAELLSARLSGTPELRNIAERIHRSAKLTSRRVNALLQLSRHPARTEYESLALTALVKQEMERCRPLLEGKSISLTFDGAEEVFVNASYDLAAIAIGNLLQNACTYTSEGAVRVALDRGSLTIEDTGPGVPPAVRSRLFEPFVRGSDDGSTGWGLGLSIAKRVMDHLVWTIRLDTTYVHGSRFVVTFPAPKET